MRWRWTAQLSMFICICISPAGASTANDSRSFTIAVLGLKLKYPKAWRRFGLPDADNLSVVRPKMAFRGPVQPHGQARLNVGPTSAPNGSEESVIRYYATDGVLGPVERIAAGGAIPCDHFARATVREDVVPPENRTVAVRDIVSTVMVCATPAGVVVGTASVWADDPHRARADADLLAIMRSLRWTATAKRSMSAARPSSTRAAAR